MVAIIMPADVAYRLRTPIELLKEKHGAIVRFANDMGLQIVFSESEKKMFASAGANAVVIALKDKDALDQLIPITDEEGQVNYLPVISTKARKRLDPFDG
jgi:hypothetical protein